MTAEADSQLGAEVLNDSGSRPFLRRALDFVFGYDFFISYAWSDGAAYATALARKLQVDGFEVFLDRDKYAAGDDWKKIGAWTLRRSGQLILVASPKALQSPPVVREVEIFGRTGRRIIPVDFGGSTEWKEFDSPLKKYLPVDILRIKEPADVLAVGPSDETVAYLRRTFKLVRQDRKRVRVFAIIALALFALSIASTTFGVFAVQQREKAERRFDKAINIAEGVVDKSVKLSDRYGVPKSATGDLLDWADQSFGELSKEGLPDRLKVAQANTFLVFSDYWAAVNNAEKQLRSAQQARDILAPLVEANSENDQWRERLSIVYDRLGNAYFAQGRYAEALGAFREQQRQDERLLARRPSDLARQRSLSVSHERIGATLLMQGHLQDAWSAQNAAFEIDKRLAAENPNEIEPQRDLAVSFEKKGELLDLMDKKEESIDSHSAALRIRQELAIKFINNTAIQRELEVSFNKVGKLLLVNKNFSEAQAAFQASLEIAKRLSESDRNNAEWLHDLAAVQSGLGDAFFAQGKRTEALSAYRAALEIVKQLVAANPQNATFQFGLAAANENIGNIQLDMGNADLALGSYQRKREIAAALVARDPDSGEFQRDFLIANVKVGDALHALHPKGADRRAEIESYSKALVIAKDMQARGRLNPEDAWMLTNLENRVGK